MLDFITAKVKAGQIIPALSTTTSIVASLQVIEYLKYLKFMVKDQPELGQIDFIEDCKERGGLLNKFKNAFINLSIPMITFSEPGEK